MPRFEWYCHRHDTTEPTRYACVEDVLRAKDEEIARLRAKIADWEDAGREWSAERERLRVAAARETLRANAYLNRIKELKALRGEAS